MRWRESLMMEKATGCRVKNRRPKIWSDHSDVGFLKGPLGIHAGTQEILDGTYYHYTCVTGRTDRISRRIGRGTVHLHVVLVLLFDNFEKCY